MGVREKGSWLGRLQGEIGFWPKPGKEKEILFDFPNLFI
jgi:hypothetical protein